MTERRRGGRWGVLGRFSAGKAFRGVLVLASGSGLAQVISVLSLPAITRLFSPEEYAVLGLYSAWVTVLGGVAGAKYEAAIPLPQYDFAGGQAARGLLQVASLIILVVFGVTLVGISLGVAVAFEPLALMGKWALMIPVGVALSGMSAALGMMATRFRAYGRLSISNPVQKSVGVVLQLLGGVFRFGPGSLLVGAVAQALTGVVMLFTVKDSDGRGPFAEKVSRRHIVTLLKQYRDFPLLSAPAALVSTLTWSLPVIILASFHSPAAVGSYSFALGLVGLPLNVVLVATNQVYLRESAAVRGNVPKAMALAKRFLWGLFALSVPIFVALGLMSAFAIEWLFGPSWGSAGSVCLALLPLLWARFMTTTLTVTFSVYRRQTRFLLWQIVMLLLTVGVFVAGGMAGWGLGETVFAASVAGAICYSLLLPMVFRVINAGGDAEGASGEGSA